MEAAPAPKITKRRKPTQRQINDAYEAFEALEKQPHLTLVASHGGTDEEDNA
jgi:hypothetical protein